MSQIAIYPGTFDPITNGHLDVIARSCKMFDEVVVAVAKSGTKSPLFSAQNRLQMVQKCIEHFSNVKVELFDCLSVDFAKAQNARFIIRGLRAVSDFEYELQMCYANKALNVDIETVFLMSEQKYSFVSSSIARNILYHDGDVSCILPKEIIDFVKDIKEQGTSCI